MNSILQSIVPVIQQAEYVGINDKILEEICACFETLNCVSQRPYRPSPLSQEEKLQFHLVSNAINFCFWSIPPAQKWEIEYQDKIIGGAYGMKAALHRAREEGYPILDASYLETLREQDFAHIVRVKGNLPLFHERISFLQQLGSILKKRYDGKAVNVVDAGEGDTLKLLDEVTSQFPCYDDHAVYKGSKVFFHKRAQLVVDESHETLEPVGRGLFRIEELTALADYKVPQVLRNIGILEYQPELAERVDSYQIISANSPEE